MSSVQKVKEWIDKHAAVIDPKTQSLLQKELEVEQRRVAKNTKRKKVRA